MLNRFSMRAVAAFAMLALVSACGIQSQIGAKKELGDFVLGHNIVVAPDLYKGPASREASKEEWIAATKAAIDTRFAPYEGERLYHLGVNVSGYVLAQPGVPVVLSPKSVLIITVSVWDDAKNKKLNEEPKRITVVESTSGDTFIGSGLTMTKEEQMANLAENAAGQIEKWLTENPEWFEEEASKAQEAAKKAPEAEKPAQDAPKEEAGDADEGPSDAAKDAEDAAE